MWKLSDSDHSCHGAWKSDPWSNQVDLLFPDAGVTFQHADVSLQVLSVHTPGRSPGEPETLIDHYARGNDLIAVYAQTPARTVRPEIYWSRIDGDGCVGVQVQVSMQTSLLASEPTLVTSTRLDSAPEMFHLGSGESVATIEAGAFVLFPIDDDWSYAEMSMPSDFAGGQLACDEQGVTLRQHFFPNSLEKGVIRRVRLMGALVPQANAMAAATGMFQRWVAEPPPLTT